MPSEATPARQNPLKRPFSELQVNLASPAGRWGSSSPAFLAKEVSVKPVVLPPTPQSDSPVKRSDPQLFIAIRPRQTLYIGRKCPMPVPAGMDAFVSLPPSAKHASRVHARVSLTVGLSLCVEVLGQNGVCIEDTRYRAGERFESEGRLEVGTVLTLDFFGCLVLLEVEVPLRTSSSPPRLAAPLPLALTSDSAIDSPPLSDDAVSMEESDEEAEVEPLVAPIVAAVAAPAPSAGAEQLLSAAAEAGIDLIGTIASALVFQSRATLSTAEICDAAEETCPALKQLRLWHEVIVERVLASGPFGRIDSAGVRDADGHRVNSWFYRPDLDADKERVASLAPFAKAPRAAQRGPAKQYYFAPIEMNKRRRN